MSNEPRRAGRHFLQIPGPTPIPERILAAMSRQILDHRGLEFQKLGKRVLLGVKSLFKTSGHVIIYPSSGTGAWEAALTNTLSPGDKVLMCETGQFAVRWGVMAQKLGLKADIISTDWRVAVDGNTIEAKLKADTAHEIKAVCVVHNETSTGCRSRIDDVRKALDASKHPALLMVDTIFLARLYRSAPRRVGHRRDRRRVAEGHDAAAGPLLHGVRKRRSPPPRPRSCRAPIWPGTTCWRTTPRLLPLYARDRPSLRPGGSDRHAQRGRARQRLRPP